MMKLANILLISSLVGIISCEQPEVGRRTFLVIFAHPDDETTIGPMMAKYAIDNEVKYIVATDGRYGTRVNKFPEDSLVDIRRAECECSAKALGIGSPVMLGFHDGFGIVKGIGQYFYQTDSLKKVLTSYIERIDPDFIITFGPDGDSGHPDHRIIGDITTEILLREGWVEKYPLYYLGWTKQQAGKFGIEELSYVDSRYFDVSIPFTDEDERKYFESIRCYKSQNTEQEIVDWIAAETKDPGNVLHFRKFIVAGGKRDKFE